MERVHQLHREFFRGHSSEFGWRVSSTLFCFALLLLLLTLLATKIHSLDLSSMLLGIALATFGVVLFFLSRSLLQLREEQRQTADALDTTETSLLESEQRFQQMADNIQEIFWMIDAETRKTLYVNPAYETITGRSLATLKEDPLSYKEIIHSDDRDQVLLKLEQATRTGQFDEKFRIVQRDGELRWVWVHGFPVRDVQGKIRRLVGTALDITIQKQTEEEVVRNLSLAECAWAEADAMRKATLALTQDLRMDYVLDTLLESLRDLVPYESANILLVETDSRLFLAREYPLDHPARSVSKYPAVFDASDYPIIKRILRSHNSVLVSDTSRDDEWRIFEGHDHLRSWLCVPLIASDRTVGMLSVGETMPDALTSEHLRIAELLAIPAAAAIQNARLFERAEIYSEELEKRLADLHQAQIALAKMSKTADFPVPPPN